MSANRTQNFIKALQSFPPWLRKVAGIMLIIFGVLGFLPIVGFWMIPLGLIVLSADYRFAKRIYVVSRLTLHQYRKKKRRRLREQDV